MPNIEKILHAINSHQSDQTYAPREDTFLILDVLTNIPVHGKKVLEIGTGSGILGLFCAQNGAQVTVTDVEDTTLENVSAAARSLGLKIKTIKSNMFLTVDGQFNIVLFNPPYLPSEDFRDTTTDGGICGRKFIDQFLEGLATHLTHDGLDMLLVSSVNRPNLIIRDHPEYSVTVAAQRTLFFEELQVLLCRLRNSAAG